MKNILLKIALILETVVILGVLYNFFAEYKEKDVIKQPCNNTYDMGRDIQRCYKKANIDNIYVKSMD